MITIDRFFTKFNPLSYIIIIGLTIYAFAITLLDGIIDAFREAGEMCIGTWRNI